jgi:hypothetical protein
MPRDWLNTKDTPLLAFTQQFSTKLTATPTAYNCTAGQATSLAGLLATFSTALAAALDPETRGRSTLAAKNTAKTALISEVRALAKQIQGSQNVTDQQRTDLGLPVRAQPTPIPPPATAPTIDILSAVGRTVTLKLHDSTGAVKRGKPPFVNGACVYSFVGATPPDDATAWTFEGITSLVKFPVQFPTTVAAGAQVWFCAFWFNERKQNGPASDKVTINIPGGSVSIPA